MLQVFLFGCRECLRRMFASVFCQNVAYVFTMTFLSVFISVSDAYFKCFIFLQTHVVKVSSKCFKSRPYVIHVAM
jgi:hypothetical protein